MKRSQVYELIDSERDYQDQQWPSRGIEEEGSPVPSYMPSNELTIGEFILLVEEYTTKARLAWTQEKRPELTALDNIRKIAGIAVNCMEQHGGVKRDC